MSSRSGQAASSCRLTASATVLTQQLLLIRWNPSRHAFHLCALLLMPVFLRPCPSCCCTFNPRDLMLCAGSLAALQRCCGLPWIGRGMAGQLPQLTDPCQMAAGGRHCGGRHEQPGRRQLPS